MITLSMSMDSDGNGRWVVEWIDVLGRDRMRAFADHREGAAFMAALAMRRRREIGQPRRVVV